MEETRESINPSPVEYRYSSLNDEKVVAAPFMDSKTKWVIYRSNGVEVVVNIISSKDIICTERLTSEERQYIRKEILKQYKLWL